MRRRAILLFSLAAVMAIPGIALVGLYGWTVWSVMDEADRSLIFWYLPFLMFGLILLGGMVTLAALGWVMQRENGRRDSRPGQTESDNAQR